MTPLERLNAKVVLALGAIAWRAVPQAPAPKFAHGAEAPLGLGTTLVGCYHVSQQNTQTGRLTPAMFDAVLLRVRALLSAR